MAQLERDTRDKRFPDSATQYLQGKNYRFFSSEPALGLVDEDEVFLMENAGTLYLAVRHEGQIKKTALT